jgi:hypothetical protein
MSSHYHLSGMLHHAGSSPAQRTDNVSDDYSLKQSCEIQQGAAELIAAGVLPLIRAVNCPNLSQITPSTCDKNTAEINRGLTSALTIQTI